MGDWPRSSRRSSLSLPARSPVRRPVRSCSTICPSRCATRPPGAFGSPSLLPEPALRHAPEALAPRGVPGRIAGQLGGVPARPGGRSDTRGLTTTTASTGAVRATFPDAELYLCEWHLRHALERLMSKIHTESEHRAAIDALLPRVERPSPHGVRGAFSSATLLGQDPAALELARGRRRSHEEAERAVRRAAWARNNLIAGACAACAPPTCRSPLSPMDGLIGALRDATVAALRLQEPRAHELAAAAADCSLHANRQDDQLAYA